MILMLTLCPAVPASPDAAGGGARPQALPEALFNQAAGLAGLPGLSSGPSHPSDGGRRASAYMRSGLPSGYAPGLDGELRYDLRGRDDPTSGRRITAASGSSRDLSEFDPLRLAQERAMSYGLGLANSLGEAALSGLADNGRAHLNFSLDWDGRFRGEGDVLLPLYDGQYTTLFAQAGARSMAVSGGEADGKDRWIGNFGLGQRWFPGATKEDAGDWMFGYNAFFDYDFTRSHQRGGLGVELQYDWLRLASNYYFPLSGWKGSYDFDRRLVEERPAKGWDARVKAYLPFYRNLALSGAYTQWYGEHVGMFGADRLEQDPKVWSYGLEYTPVPLLSAFLTQRSTEQGRTDTEFGLSFTYRFGMPWEEQIRHSKVAELRTVSGARHEFVDRENRIILEYRAKNAYRIEYLGVFETGGQRLHQFRLRNGFGEIVPGQSVSVTAHGGAWLLGPQSSLTTSTDGKGMFAVELEPSAPDPTTVTVRAGGTEQDFKLSNPSVAPTTFLTLTPVPGPAFYMGPSGQFRSTASITATATANGSTVTINPGEVTWTVENSSITAAWWGNRSTGATNGLAWGQSAIWLNGTEAERTDMSGNGGVAPDGDTAYLTDIVGSRTVTVKASMVIDGKTVSETATVSFGDGPLSVFGAAPTASDRLTWAAASSKCGTVGNPNIVDYQPSTNLPRQEHLRAVAGPGEGGQGAAHAAGWPEDGHLPPDYQFRYWSGEPMMSNMIYFIRLDNGDWDYAFVSEADSVAVCLRAP
jgi:hypothetical protein